ncbi:MAG: flagellar motor switch protein FliG, partial [Gammaproteobacteria bacterium]
MAKSAENFDGAQKAAVFLMAIGESAAAEVMKHLGPREVQKIGVAMSALEIVSPENVQTSINDFMDSVRSHTGIGIGSED